MPELAAALAASFGYSAFRPHQEEVIRAILAGRDTFTIMPTGAGKSLCYQLPARLLPGVCVVVSPLISLMKDQVDSARANGFAARTLNSATTAAERSAALRELREGRLELLYVAPERLCLPEFLEILRGVPLAFFAVDEAHCISSWGHDFRPDYRGLSVIVETFPGTPVAAFTATATERVAEDIVSRLGLRNPLRIKSSFNRPNLFYQVSPRENLEAQLIAFLAERAEEPGIIYRGTRKDTEATAAFLRAKGFDALPYHAGLPDALRAETQEAFRRDTTRLVVATIAFGMGIDKPNVRFVVHGDLPASLEGYYQETGRAGRDGDPARCVLFYGRQDVPRLLGFAEKIEDPDAREAARRQVFSMLEYTRQEGCRRKALLRYFGEQAPDACGFCDICAGEVERVDATVPAQKLLSAIARTGGRFGARHVVNIVLGKETGRIIRFGHQHLPTFGVGRDESPAFWNQVMDAALIQGLVTVDDPRYPTPALTEAGWRVLRGQAGVRMIRQAENTARRVRVSTPSDEGGECPDEELLQALRRECRRLAAAGGLPVYAVFPDRCLRDMVRLLPQSPREMLAISGVGKFKMDAYGWNFIEIIAERIRSDPATAARAAALQGQAAFRPDAPPDIVGERRLKDGDAEAKAAVEPGRKTRCRGDSALATAGLLEQGLDIQAVAAARGLAPSTILGHMEVLARQGRCFSPKRFISAAKLVEARELFLAAGAWNLRPVVEASRARHGEESPDALSFEDARLARLFLHPSGAGQDAAEKEQLED